MRKNKIILIAIIAVMLWGGCKKKEQSQPQEPIWEMDTDFKGVDKIILNSAVFENEMYMLGIGVHHYFFPDSRDSNKIEKKGYLFQSSYGVREKPVYHDRIFIDLFDPSNGFIHVRRREDLFQSVGSGFIILKDVDSLFAALHLSIHWLNTCFAINNRNQILVPYRRLNEDRISSSIAYMLIDVEFNSSLNGPPLKLSARRVTGLPMIVSVSAFKAIDENFFLNHQDRTYMITANNDVFEIFNQPITKFLEVRFEGSQSEILLGTAYNGTIYKSLDRGYTWLPYIMDSGYPFEWFTYYNINDNIIGVRNSKLFHFRFFNNEVSIKEIKSDGLEGHHISSISLFKGTYYVTTFSGVFTKKAEHFLTYVE